MIEAAPDALPMIGEVEGLPGYYMATGFSGHGFGIGPGAGKVIADLVSGAPPAFDLSPFRLSRFLTARRSGLARRSRAFSDHSQSYPAATK